MQKLSLSIYGRITVLLDPNRIHGARFCTPGGGSIIVVVVVERVFRSSKQLFAFSFFSMIYCRIHDYGTSLLSSSVQYVRVCVCVCQDFFSIFDILSVSVRLTMNSMNKIYIYRIFSKMELSQNDCMVRKPSDFID